jgi:hypothetical protein
MPEIPGLRYQQRTFSQNGKLLRFSRRSELLNKLIMKDISAAELNLKDQEQSMQITKTG